MRIAIVSHNLARDGGGGQARVNFELARHCRAHGCRVHVVSQHISAELLDAGVHWHQVTPSLPKPQVLSNWTFAARADGTIARLRPNVDVVVGNGFVTRTQTHDVSICHMLHSAWLRSPFYPWRSWRLARPSACYQAAYTRVNSRWEWQTYTAATRVVAVSRKVEEELRVAGIPPQKIRVICNGVDTDEFRPGPADRRCWNLPQGVPLALFAGGIRTSLRNLESVLEAIARVPGVHLAVAGDTRRSPYPAQAQRLGLSDRVHFLGYRGDVANLMRAADFFIYPSRYEACSLVLLEAMGSGLPIITARSAGGSELLDPSCAWVLDDPNNVTAIAAHVRTLAFDTGRRHRMSMAARECATRLTWMNTCGAYVKLFDECARDVRLEADAAPAWCPQPA